MKNINIMIIIGKIVIKQMGIISIILIVIIQIKKNQKKLHLVIY